MLGEACFLGLAASGLAMVPEFPHNDCMVLVSRGVPCDKRLEQVFGVVVPSGVTQRNDVCLLSGIETSWGIPRCEHHLEIGDVLSMFQCTS